MKNSAFAAFAIAAALLPAAASHAQTRVQGEVLLEAHAPSQSLAFVASERALFSGAVPISQLRVRSLADIAPVPGWNTMLNFKIRFDLTVPTPGRYAFATQMETPWGLGYKQFCGTEIRIGDHPPTRPGLEPISEPPAFGKEVELAAGTHPVQIYVACARDRVLYWLIQPGTIGNNSGNPIRISMREPRGTIRALRANDVSIVKSDSQVAAEATASAAPAVRVLRPGVRRESPIGTLAETAAGGFAVEYRALQPQSFRSANDFDKHFLSEPTNALAIPPAGASIRNIAGAAPTRHSLLKIESNFLVPAPQESGTWLAFVLEEQGVYAAFCGSRLFVNDREIPQVANAGWTHNLQASAERGHGLIGLFDLNAAAPGAYAVRANIVCAHLEHDRANPALKIFVKRPGDERLRPATATDFAIEKPKN